MVFYFTSTDGHVIYMVCGVVIPKYYYKLYFIFYSFTDNLNIFLYFPQGADKFENEDLIKYGHLEDIWFHVLLLF